jgi:hypothetical protein
MNCPYCQQAMQPTTCPNDGALLEGFICDNHPHKVSLMATPSRQFYGLDYHLRYRDMELKVEVYKFHDGMGQWTLLHGFEVIIRLDFLPKNLTPDSIDARLPTLLLFS